MAMPGSRLGRQPPTHAGMQGPGPVPKARAAIPILPPILPKARAGIPILPKARAGGLRVPQTPIANRVPQTPIQPNPANPIRRSS